MTWIQKFYITTQSVKCIVHYHVLVMLGGWLHGWSWQELKRMKLYRCVIISMFWRIAHIKDIVPLIMSFEVHSQPWTRVTKMYYTRFLILCRIDIYNFFEGKVWEEKRLCQSVFFLYDPMVKLWNFILTSFPFIK